MTVNTPVRGRKYSCYAALGLALMSVGAVAQVPHTFAPGQSASAQQMNENFSSLDERMAALLGSKEPITINCEQNPTALDDAVALGYRDISIEAGSCSVGWTLNRDVLVIRGTAGSSDVTIRPFFGIDGDNFFNEQGVLLLENLRLEGALVQQQGEAILRGVTIDCALLRARDPNAYSIILDQTQVSLENVVTTGCNGIEATASNINLLGSTIEAPVGGQLLSLRDQSTLYSGASNWLSSDTTASWKINIGTASSAVFNGGRIKSGVYSANAQLVIRDLLLEPNGPGQIQIAAHFSTDLMLRNVPLQNVGISNFAGGNIHIGDDPNNTHSNVEMSMDGGYLSFGGAFTGTNITARIQSGTRVKVGIWEAGSQQVNNDTVFSLSPGAWIDYTATSGVTVGGINCMFGLTLENYFSEQTCAGPVPQ